MPGDRDRRGHAGLWRTAAALGCVAVCVVAGCAGKPARRATRPELPPIEAPEALRGTLATQADLFGVEPTLVSGLGFVVGLTGTGGQVVDERVAATMEREMGLMGVGTPGAWENTPLEGVTPRQLLADPNTAVVVVTAAVPPGAPDGFRFDVFVRALNASSLDGGRLWTCDLRLGRPGTFGGQQARKLGEASGDIFINPFAEPGSERTSARGDVGRILSGGVVTDGLDVEVRLRSPSHARARIMTSAINSLFPQREGDRTATARGLDESSIAVRVPRRYLDDTGTFIELLRYMQIDNQFPQVYAQRYADAVKQEPYLAGDLSWALQALGEPALPIVRGLYDDPEVAPRLAALRAGAGLGDALAAKPLTDLARTGPLGIRPDAIRLLGRLEAGPGVDVALRELLREPELTVRIAAYEALADRAERAQRRRLLSQESGLDVAPGQRLSLNQLEMLSTTRLPAGTLQGVSRVPIGGKFFLDRVPIGEPMIYVTQVGTPRIVLFGERVELRRPMFVRAWSDRLMFVAEGATDTIRARYETLAVQSSRSPDAPAPRVFTASLEPSVAELIDLMASPSDDVTPRVGWSMSYSEVVGALHALWREGALAAAFATERDKLVADLIAANDATPITARPESEADTEEVVIMPDPLSTRPDEPAGPRLGEDGRPTLVVPIERPAEGKGGADERRGGRGR